MLLCIFCTSDERCLGLPVSLMLMYLLQAKYSLSMYVNLFRLFFYRLLFMQQIIEFWLFTRKQSIWKGQLY